jgi:Methyltransferase domain
MAARVAGPGPEDRVFGVAVTEAFPNHVPLLKELHAHLAPRTYVEIGVLEGASFATVLPETVAVGIDPILARQQPVNRSARLFAVTSDEFFAKHDLASVLDGMPVDLAFIDGMHLFEFALRDFMHLEKFCTSDSVILVHDCYPGDAKMAARKMPTTGWWTGDVWKLVICLKEYRPELQISVVDVPPTGLGIVTGLNPASTVLKDHYEEICGRFLAMDYSVLADGKEQKLSRVANDWEVVQRLLRQPRRGADYLATD